MGLSIGSIGRGLDSNVGEKNREELDDYMIIVVSIGRRISDNE